MEHLIRSYFFLALIINVSTSTFAASELYRPQSESVGKGAYEINLTGSLFSSSAKLDELGDEVAFGDSESFSKIDGDLSLAYGFGKVVEFSLATRFRSINNQFLLNNAAETVSRSGAESFALGVKYMMKAQGRWSFAGEVGFRQTLHDNVSFPVGTTIPANEEIVLGDAGREITLTGHTAFRRKSTHYLAGAVSYRTPANNLSGEVPYFVESVWLHRPWAFKLGVKGIYSLGQDEFKDNAAFKPRQNTGATNLFNSVNRQFLAPYGGLSYAFKSFRADFTASQVMTGVSTDKGLELIFGISWRSKGGGRNQEKINSFKEYTIEASVIKVSPKGKFLKIDQGISGDVEKGMKFDIYQTDFFGGNVLVASGFVFEVGADWSIIKLSKRYKNIPVKKGFAARGN